MQLRNYIRTRTNEFELLRQRVVRLVGAENETIVDQLLRDHADLVRLNSVDSLGRNFPEISLDVKTNR